MSQNYLPRANSHRLEYAGLNISRSNFPFRSHPSERDLLPLQSTCHLKVKSNHNVLLRRLRLLRHPMVLFPLQTFCLSTVLPPLPILYLLLVPYLKVSKTLGHRYTLAQRIQCLTLLAEGCPAAHVKEKTGVRERSQRAIYGTCMCASGVKECLILYLRGAMYTILY